MWLWIANKLAKFRAKRLNQNKNIPKSFMGATFWNTMYIGMAGSEMHILTFLSRQPAMKNIYLTV